MAKYEKLFDEFPPQTMKDWEDKIVQDLKGTSYDRLIWKNIEGIDIKPFYTKEDLQSLSFPQLNSKGSNTAAGSHSWEIREDITVEDWEKANKKALNALNKGATSLAFIIPNENKISPEKLETLLKDIVIECIDINFISYSQTEQIIEFLTDHVGKNGTDPRLITGSVGFDPLGHLTRYGNLPSTLPSEFSTLGKMRGKTAKELPSFRICCIEGAIFHNAGSTIVQELAYSLSILSEYLEVLTENGVNPEDAFKNIQFNMAAGPVYFMEIAKFRAMRLLFELILKAWEPSGKTKTDCYIHASTSTWNQTIYDPYVNMLRSTTEGMSAALGGVNSLSVTPFDHAFRPSTQFSERIARNTQIVLKEEAYLDRVNDVSAGCYYIESLTGSLVTNAWKLFKEIEKDGGYLKALQKGVVQKAIAETAAKRDKNIAERKKILLGTNQYPNPDEKSTEVNNSGRVIPEYSFYPEKIIQPLLIYRGSEAFEKLRVRTEKADHRPVVFLLTYGNPVVRKARAGFASGFFACAGYEIIDNEGFSSPEEGYKAAGDAKADIIVLCSSDEEYLPLASELSKLREKRGNKSILVIAGNPKESLNELKQLGISHFIHIKSNLLEELMHFQEELNI